jgi:ceramide glucosyltransferase
MIANHLADDFRLGELVRALGQSILMSKYHVKAQHDEKDLPTLFRHEMRWMRTLRVLKPRSFAMLFLSFSLPMAVLGLLLCLTQPAIATIALSAFGITLIARLLMSSLRRAPAERSLWADLYLLPVRDFLTLAVWCGCFFTSRVQWRGIGFEVDADGIMR